ncbi:MAG: ABC transporter ATP-binding protein [Candidatus Nanopelagicales bacterium]
MPAGVPALRIDRVTQRFSLHHEKTLRGLFVNAVQRSHPSRETFLALEDVSLEIPSGTTMGLIGHNGSGKSTLLKIIGGVLTPTSGQVTRRGRLAALLELGAGFQRDLTGRQNVYMNAELLGLSRKTTEAKFDEIVAFSGVEQFIDTPMKFYSSGMFMRLGFSVAIHTDPDVLLVDEVLAVGDEEFQAKCLDVVRRMQNEGRTIVLVTHSMQQITQFCDRATLLHHGRVHAQGTPAEVIAAFREVTGKDKKQPVGSTEQPATPTPAAARPVPTVGTVTCRSDSGRPLGDLRTGDSLHIEASFRGMEPGEPFIGRLDLFSGGQLLLGTSTDRLGMDPFCTAGQVGCSFTIPDLPLAAGRYRVALSTAASRSGPVLHTLPAAVEFSIAGEAPTVGPLAVRPTATVSRDD